MPDPRHRLTTTTAARLAAVAVMVVMAASCSGSDDARRGDEPPVATTLPVSEFVYPGEQWQTVDPSTAGFDPVALDELNAMAQAANSSCLVVTRDGVVVDEQYWGDAAADTPREVYSVTKSVTSVLAGIARDQGSLDFDVSASEYIPQWQGTGADVVTVRDLLSNDSGREWDRLTDYGGMAINAEDKTAFAIGLEQTNQPGEVWAYNNSAIQTLSEAMLNATGEPATDFAETNLFGPIGMDDSSMTTDEAGNALMFMGLQSTCLDLARFGYLMLRDGSWDGRQIVSRDYVEQAVGQPSTPLNDAYGLLWWLNREGRVGSTEVATSAADEGLTFQSQLVPGAPEDIFWALGLQKQLVAVIPSEGVVAVRLGTTPPGTAPFTQRELTLGVLRALGALDYGSPDPTTPSGD